MVANKSPSKKIHMPTTAHHTTTYMGYIRQVVVDRKVCKTCTIIDIFSFINTRLHCFLDSEQHELGTIEFEIIYAVEG